MEWKSEYQIQAAYMTMKNNGQFYVSSLGSEPIFIDDWLEREMKRFLTPTSKE